MTNDKGSAPGARTTRESDIFRDPPGSGNYSSSIGAAQRIELFGGSGRVRRARPAKIHFTKSQAAVNRLVPKNSASLWFADTAASTISRRIRTEGEAAMSASADEGSNKLHRITDVPASNEPPQNIKEFNQIILVVFSQLYVAHPLERRSTPPKSRQ